MPLTTVNGRGRGRPRLGVGTGGTSENVRTGNTSSSGPSLGNGDIRCRPSSPGAVAITDLIVAGESVMNIDEGVDDHDDSHEALYASTSALGIKREEGGDSTAGTGSSSSATGQHSSPKRRRKVSHGMFTFFPPW